MAFDVVLTPDFKRELKHIAKKHRQILKDLNVLIDGLIENPAMGTDLGQNIYKIRLLFLIATKANLVVPE